MRGALFKKKDDESMVLSVKEVDKITSWFLLYDTLSVTVSDFELVLETFLGYSPSKLQLTIMLERAKKSTDDKGADVIEYNDVITVFEARKRVIVYCLYKCQKSDKKKNWPVNLEQDS